MRNALAWAIIAWLGIGTGLTVGWLLSSRKDPAPAVKLEHRLPGSPCDLRDIVSDTPVQIAVARVKECQEYVRKIEKEESDEHK